MRGASSISREVVKDDHQVRELTLGAMMPVFTVVLRSATKRPLPVFMRMSVVGHTPMLASNLTAATVPNKVKRNSAMEDGEGGHFRALLTAYEVDFVERHRWPPLIRFN